MPLPALAALAPFAPIAGAVLGGIFSARQAAQNREFQERMSSTAHEREVRDLRRAGMNPILTTRSGGASTPSGNVAQTPEFGGAAAQSINSALALRRAKLENELLASQVDKTVMETKVSGQSLDERIGGQQSRLDILSSERQLAAMSVDQRREMFQQEIAKVKQEISNMVTSAKGVEARTVLDQLAREGAFNEAEFERRIGQLTPALRRLVDLMRIYNLASGEPVRRIP